MIHHFRHDFVELLFIYICAILAILFFLVFAAPSSSSTFGVIVPAQKEEVYSMYKVDIFKNISVIAKAYIVYDLIDKKVIASKNPDVVLPIASITKLMTAITALIHYDKTTLITINKTNLDEGYDLGLKEKQVWKLGELLKYTLVFSSNDGAQAIADGLMGREKFVSQMNTDAILLGLKLNFTNPAGLDINGASGGEGSVLEVAKMFAVAHKKFPEILDATTKTRATVIASTGKIFGVPNTNQSIMNLASAEASKTGFTNEAGGNLAVIVDVSVGHPVVIVVLGSSYEGRFTDVETLYKALLKSLK